MSEKSFKIIALFVVFSVLMSLLAACGGATPSPVPASEKAKTEGSEAQQAPTIEETKPEGAQSQEQVPATENGKAYTIGLCSFQQGNDWNIQVAEGAKARIAELGWKVIHTNAEGNTDNQIAALEGFLTQKVDGVIVGGGSGPALEPAIKKLIQAGIPVVTIDLTIPDAVTNIFPDNYMSTELLAVFAVNKLQARPGKYAHVTIPGLGWKTVDIRDFIADKIFEIEGWTNVGIIDSGLQDAVNQTMTGVRSTLLANPDLDMIYSSWGMPAVGAARAIREADKQGKVFVVATDADRIVLAEMAKDDSPIAAVIGQKPLEMGRMAVDYLNKAFAGEKNIPKITFAPFVFVTKEPQLLPPGPEAMDPKKAWEVLYPGIEFGKTE